MEIRKFLMIIKETLQTKLQRSWKIQQNVTKKPKLWVLFSSLIVVSKSLQDVLILIGQNLGNEVASMGDQNSSKSRKHQENVIDEFVCSLVT